MGDDALVVYYWRVRLKGHLRHAFFRAVDLSGAKEKGARVGKVISVERLMPVKKGKAKGYSFPTTFWQEGGKG